MNFEELKKLLNLANKAKLNIQVTGKSGIGKTHFCKEIFPDAIIILAYELHKDNLLFLKGAFETKKTIIFENITEKEQEFLEPIITNKVLFGKPLENFFIITTQRELNFSKTFNVNFNNPGSVAWLKWANANGINKFIIKAIENKDLLKDHKPRDLESLSKLLNEGVSADILDIVLKSFLKDDYASINLIKKEYAKTTPLPLTEILEDKKKPQDLKSLKIFEEMLNNETKEQELLKVLQDKKIQKLIDENLQNLL